MKILGLYIRGIDVPIIGHAYIVRLGESGTIYFSDTLLKALGFMLKCELLKLKEKLF